MIVCQVAFDVRMRERNNRRLGPAQLNERSVLMSRQFRLGLAQFNRTINVYDKIIQFGSGPNRSRIGRSFVRLIDGDRLTFKWEDEV